MSTPHYFIAIPLPLEIKEGLEKWQLELRDYLSYKQWPHLEDLHITLKFLGAVDDDKINELKVSLKQIEKFPPFQATIKSLGTFGKQDKPRVVWAGLESPEALKELQAKVEKCAEQVGFSKENRPFRPHITLAKKWDGDRVIYFNDLKSKYEKQQFELKVESIVIYQIFPSSKPKYKAIETFDLGGGE